MEGELEGVDSVQLKIRGYSMVWGVEGIMQDGGVCLERRMGRVRGLLDDSLTSTRQSTPFIEENI